MSLQNNWINNGETNGLKQKEEKNMQKVLYAKIKEKRGKWLFGANTQNIPFNCNNATQDKTNACKALNDEG